MSDPTVVSLITETLKEHQWWFVGNLGVPGMPDSKDYKCSCGWTAGGGIGVGEDPYAHVSGVVASRLNERTCWFAATKPEACTSATNPRAMQGTTRAGSGTAPAPATSPGSSYDR